MNWSKAHFGIAILAVATAGLIIFAPEDGINVVSEPAKSKPLVAVKQVENMVSSPSEGELLASARNRSTLKEDASGRLFAQGTWFVAPPPVKPVPPPPPPPPPPPTAPPLPYIYLGKYSEGELQIVVMTRGNRVVTASRGDVLENTYRIDRIEATNVIFTYLPLNISQTLMTGGMQ